MNIDLFQSCGHCWVFQICWHIECSTLTASSFKIGNSSAGITSPPLALVMFPKAHLTSQSRMSASRWVITPSWLSGSWRSLLYSSSVYSCHRFLILSALRWHQSHFAVKKWMNKEVVVRIHNGIQLNYNRFESVLMRWMNLEPIIQSEVSQKEKDQYHILTHI